MSAHAFVQMSLVGEAVEHGPALVFVADENMRYAAVNERACSELGYTREQLLSMTVTDIARYEEASAEFAEMMLKGERTGRARLMRKDGSELEIEYRASKTTVAGLPYYVSVGWPV